MISRVWAAALVLMAAVATACGAERAVAPSPSPTPAPVLLPFHGKTFSFAYPQGWHVWSESFRDGQETVTIANIPAQTPGPGWLPFGAIKIDFASTEDLSFPVEPPPRDAQLLSFPPSNVKFFLWRGDEGVWTIQGVLRAPDRLYIVGVFMDTEPPATEVVAPILGSWLPTPP